MAHRAMDDVAAQIRAEVATEVERAIRAARRDAAWVATTRTAAVLAFVFIVVNHRLGPVAVGFVGLLVSGLVIAAEIHRRLSRWERLQRWTAKR